MPYNVQHGEVQRNKCSSHRNQSERNTKELTMAWQIPTDWQSRPVAVLGAGVLGRRIAACFLAAGHQVNIFDLTAEANEQARQYIKANISIFTGLTSRAAGQLETYQDLATAVKDVWLVFEAVPEVLSLKESMFADLERLAPKDAILGSNSSSYKTSEMLGKLQAEETKGRILNTHYMMPPEVISCWKPYVGLTDCCSGCDRRAHDLRPYRRQDLSFHGRPLQGSRTSSCGRLEGEHGVHLQPHLGCHQTRGPGCPRRGCLDT